MPKRKFGCIDGGHMNLCECKEYVEDLEYVGKFIEFEKSKSSILITGATGLIGSLIVDALMYYNQNSRNCVEVYCLSRSNNRLNERFAYWDVPQIHFIEGDIGNVDLKSFHFDYIFHTASNADPCSYALFPVDTIYTNIKGAENVLEYCRNSVTTRVLFTSTFEVYGKIEGVEFFSEEMSGIIDCSRIRSSYPESKRVVELLCRSYIQQYGVNCLIARLSSVYGPTKMKKDSKAHAQFIKNALAHEDIILKSEGNQKRTYSYAADTVSGLFYLLSYGKTGEVYNIANGKSIATISEVAKTVAEACGQAVVFEPPDEIESKGFSSPQNCVLNTRKIEELGWNGHYTLKEGIERTIRILQFIGE